MVRPWADQPRTPKGGRRLVKPAERNKPLLDHASEPTEGRATRRHETASASERRTSPFLKACKASPPKVGRGQSMRSGKRRTNAARPLAPPEGLGVAKAAGRFRQTTKSRCLPWAARKRLSASADRREAGLRQTTKSRCLLWAARERSPASVDRREAPGPKRGWLLFNSAAMSEAKRGALNSEKDRRHPSPRGW